MSVQQSINIVGLGLIGGSIAARLTQEGFRVQGIDPLASRQDEALKVGYISSVGLDVDAHARVIRDGVRGRKKGQLWWCV